MTDTRRFPSAVASMPRGGTDAGWLDRRLQTDALEYTDRDDVPAELKQRVITGLDAIGARSGQHEQHARLALDVIGDIANPRILEIGAGHGRLSEQILELHPTATVTVSDVDPKSVSNIAAGPLGSHPRARTQVVDATAIDAEDGSYDLVVFALAFHHLPPDTARQAIAEATRVADRFLVIDLERGSPLQMILTSLVMAPAALALMPRPSVWPVMHDGFISGLRAYSRSAFVELGEAADPDMQTEFLPPPPGPRFIPPPVGVVYSRAGKRES
ncbi:class I SAM-dependent methyltransferase [Mycobacterium sp. DL592]|uniref:class I SAM-dependent methyltransferase n=1 Tax=Mycobacterium sp. DL592 TaxID=2675524 RepID=UPI00142450B7|nr:class I SAM-dependent methyltransferase [Mycobacterium sp. DL592]